MEPYLRLRWWLAAVLALVASSASAQQGTVASINGQQLYYEVTGDGAPVVLIHGWSLNLRMWDPQVSALSRRFRVIRYDRRGFGKSSGVEDNSWDAADLNALLDHLKAPKVHVIGMSQGGRVALQFVRRYPDRVASLILHGCPAPDGFGLPFNGPDRTRFDEWAVIAKEKGLEAFRRDWSAHPLMAVPPGRPDAKARLTELLAAYQGGRFLTPVAASGPIPAVVMDDLAQIRVPSLVLIGDGEVPFLQIVARALIYYLPNARLTVVPGGGHMINIIEPERYNAAILEFLTTAGR